MSFMDAASRFFDEARDKEHNKEHGNKDKKEGHSGGGNKREETNNKGKEHNPRRVKSELHLVILKSPALQKIANNLFVQAVGESEDFSAYAEFLLKLDKLLREYGATPETVNHSSSSDNEGLSDDNWKE